MNVICAPERLLPSAQQDGSYYFALYSAPGVPGIGRIAPGWPQSLARQGLAPSAIVWDFVTLAHACAAADLACPRVGSADGWTRQIDLHVHLFQPDPWVEAQGLIEQALRFLTGDIWRLFILNDGPPPPVTAAPLNTDADCVALLSGGMDSLIGGIDLVRSGKQPFFVSQVAKGDKPTQDLFASRLGAGERHFQWNHRIRPAGAAERSTRGRSIIFFAYAALASSALHVDSHGPVDIFVPENGFISLNVPLNAGRLGSLSTKTTHPVFMRRVQEIWDRVGIPARLSLPYRFMTKGEMITQCLDQTLMRELLGESTSCGRFGHYNYTHCGRCVPCLVRRAAFLKAGIPDSTPRYYYNNLANAGRETGANDIGAMAAAFLRMRQHGAGRFLGGALTFALPQERPAYEATAIRGLSEVGALLQQEGVI